MAILMGPFCLYKITYIPIWISNYIHYKVWSEFTYPFPNFNSAINEVWEWKSNLIPHFTGNAIINTCWDHYGDVIMGTMRSQITSLTIAYSTDYSDADQSKHQSSASLAFVWGIHRRPLNSPHKWPVTRKMFPFDDVIMIKLIHFSKRGLWSITHVKW